MRPDDPDLIRLNTNPCRRVTRIEGAVICWAFHTTSAPRSARETPAVPSQPSSPLALQSH
jgi:hypothetical protein